MGVDGDVHSILGLSFLSFPSQRRKMFFICCGVDKILNVFFHHIGVARPMRCVDLLCIAYRDP